MLVPGVLSVLLRALCCVLLLHWTLVMVLVVAGVVVLWMLLAATPLLLLWGLQSDVLACGLAVSRVLLVLPGALCWATVDKL